MITLTSQLQAANALMNETADSLQSKTVKQLRDDAKALNIKGCYRLSKAAIIALILDEIEGLQAMMAAAGVQSEKSQVAVVALKAEGGHLPITEVVSKAYARLKSILKETHGFEAIKERVASLAATVARSELKEHEVSTAIKTRRPQIKRGLTDMAHANEGMMLQDMLDIIDVFYAALCNYQREDSIRLNKTYNAATQQKNIEKLDVEIMPLVRQCLTVLDELARGESPHWARVSTAIILGTGRRPVEVHATAGFEVIGEHELHFSGQAKTRDADGSRDEFDIPTLFPARLMKRALDFLGEQDRRLPKEDQDADSRAVNRAFGMALSRSMSRYPYPQKDVRKFYAELMWRLHGCSNREKHTYFSEIMGHSNLLGGGNTTYQSYLTYNVIDADEVIGQLGLG